jgi:hypothetical protein
MKLRIHPLLKDLINPHFEKHILPDLLFPVSDPLNVQRDNFLDYFLNVLTLQHRKHALCFFMSEIVDLVNKTNSRLLYESLLQNISDRQKSSEKDCKMLKAQEDEGEEDFPLLNAFEMLWNVTETSMAGLSDQN